MSTKYLHTFVFGFIVLFDGYDYIFYAHKLKLFLDPLKEEAIHWFMRLRKYYPNMGRECQVFIKIYQDYCKAIELREEIFKVTQE